VPDRHALRLHQRRERPADVVRERLVDLIRDAAADVVGLEGVEIQLVVPLRP
jgi:hypothetical protein